MRSDDLQIGTFLQALLSLQLHRALVQPWEIFIRNGDGLMVLFFSPIRSSLLAYVRPAATAPICYLAKTAPARPAFNCRTPRELQVPSCGLPG